MLSLSNNNIIRETKDYRESIWKIFVLKKKGYKPLVLINLMIDYIILFVFRRWMIYRCLKLTYLDGRPIHVRDRACIGAWKEVYSGQKIFF